MRIRAIGAIIFSLASPALAGEFSLELPVDCALGEDQRCFIQQYPDRDPSPRARDFMCNALTYDGHSGTDFALRDWADIARGVNVRAAAPGTVTATRDGMIDKAFEPERDSARIRGQECGNAVLIAHEGGWETQYCHLARGSVAVQRGDRVDAGTRLGSVGMSGVAQFPHVHLTVRRDGAMVDPFAPDPARACGTAQDSLWAEPIEYQAGGLVTAGFAARIPELIAIDAGDAHRPYLAATTPALVLWGYAFGTRPGDVLKLTIISPSGGILLAHDAGLDATQARAMRTSGRRTEDAAWFVPGSYTGKVEMIRDGKVISDITTETWVGE